MSVTEAAVEDHNWECFRFERVPLVAGGTADGGDAANGAGRPHVLVVTLDSPRSEINAVDEAVHGEFAQLFRLLRRENEARSIVLTGSGRAFCAGGDFDWFAELRTVEALEALSGDARQIIWDLLDVPRPIVCGLNGHAMGLGASIALLCDLVVMSSEARIGDPHVNVGLVAGDGGTVIWPALLGPLRAKEHLLLGTPVDAGKAEDLGLVNRVVPADDVRGAAIELARALGSQPPLAVKYTKLAVNQQLRSTLLSAFDVATAHELTTFRSADHAEAVAAMKEKRTPHFDGR